MKIMKLQSGLAALMLLAVCLFGCERSGRSGADYRAEAFFAEIGFSVGDLTVYAELTTVCEAGRVRPQSLRLTAPPALADAVITCEGEEVILSRDGLRLPSEGARLWWETAALLCAEGELRFICDTEENGLPLEYAEIVGADGETVGVFRERETGIPRRVCLGERSLAVLRFARTEAR